MRKVLFALACWATVGLVGARADVSYSYVTDFSSYASANAGDQVTAKVYLQELLTGGSTSFINSQNGLFGAGVLITRTAGNASFFVIPGDPVNFIPDEVITANQNRRDPNATFPGTPSGFGIAPTVVDPKPSTATQAGLIVNADIVSNANTKGPLIKAAENGGNKILLGTFNLIVGTQNSTFQVTNYGSTKNTLTQGGKDLDFGTQAVDGYNGASAPAGGFFTFTVVGAAIPEPSSMALCGLIATGLGYTGFRRRKTTAEAPATPA
jgi:hypothetical protein